MQAASALYASKQTFPTGTTPTVATPELIADLRTTLTTITYVTGDAFPSRGENEVSAYTPGDGKIAIFSAEDGDTACWWVADNESSGTIATIPPGNNFYGTTTHRFHTRCPAAIAFNAHGPFATHWKPNFKTFTKVP